MLSDNVGQLSPTTGAMNFTQLDNGSYRVVVIARNKDIGDRVALRSDFLTVE